MASKQAYKQQNIDFMKSVQTQEGVMPLGKGVYYKVLATGSDTRPITRRNVVSCYYKGSLISGRVFDDTFNQGYPEAFRVGELIDGFQMALESMHVGDHWMVYIPSEMGYGSHGDSQIPANSALVFEIKVVGLA